MDSGSVRVARSGGWREGFFTAVVVAFQVGGAIRAGGSGGSDGIWLRILLTWAGRWDLPWLRDDQTDSVTFNVSLNFWSTETNKYHWRWIHLSAEYDRLSSSDALTNLTARIRPKWKENGHHSSVFVGFTSWRTTDVFTVCNDSESFLLVPLIGFHHRLTDCYMKLCYWVLKVLFS